GLVAKAALVLAVTGASLTVAGAARVLPGPAQRMVAKIIEAVTPFDLPADDGDGAKRTFSRGPGFPTRSGEGPAADAPRLADGAEIEDGHGFQERGGTDMAPPPGKTDRGTQAPSAEGPAPAVPAGRSDRVPAPPGPSDRRPTSPPGAAAGTRRSATLTGAAQIPGPGDPDGGGTAFISLNSGQDLLCLTLSVTGIAPATSVHLHNAPAGATGPVIASFLLADDSSTGCVPVGNEVIKEIRRNPDSYYVEVHNAEFRDGALRGQLAK
ncbi:MAG: CHRD domain-containing protein, partial [Actinomycetota bacterium]|nr:CHRD domain-containing protein [Actinomycetota bacterium]